MQWAWGQATQEGTQWNDFGRKSYLACSQTVSRGGGPEAAGDSVPLRGNSGFKGLEGDAAKQCQDREGP